MMPFNNIDDLRKFIKENDLYCVEVRDYLDETVVFYFKVKGDNECLIIKFHQKILGKASFLELDVIECHFYHVFENIRIRIRCGHDHSVRIHEGNNGVDPSWYRA